MQDHKRLGQRRNRRVAPASWSWRSRRSSGAPLASSWSACAQTYSAGLSSGAYAGK